MIGRSVRRVEDFRFLTGGGRFVDDLEVPGALHCALVRSPHAHARILSIEANTSVLTGRDMAQDGVGPMRAGWQLPGMVEIPRWALARETVRHVGEPVAAVFAETRAAAEDAAEQVAVAYEALPLEEQTCFQWTRGDAAAVEKAFADARAPRRDRAGQQPPVRRGDRESRHGRRSWAGRHDACTARHRPLTTCARRYAPSSD